MKHFLIFSILFISLNFSFAQNVITKKRLGNLFRTERDYNSKQFKACNTNEKFFKSDTISFYSNVSPENCKISIIWDFYNTKYFKQLVAENHGNYGSTKY